jgi:hypothetical protein
VCGRGDAMPPGKREKGACGGVVRFMMIVLSGRFRVFVNNSEKKPRAEVLRGTPAL